jgi:hypothetical protein
MRLSEFKDEEALDLLADIIEPVGSILEDDEIAKIYEENKSDGFGIKAKLQAISVMIRNHKPEVIEILAKLNKQDVSEFHCNVLTLPKELLSLINDPIMQDFFASQVQNEGEISSAPVTEITEETEKN